MLKKLLEHFFLFITSRELLIIIGLIIVASSVPMFLEQFYFVKSHWGMVPSEHDIGEIEGLIDGFGGILVAAGVFLEERETLRSLSIHPKIPETNQTQLYLNEVAHHNGMGILLLGLFIEIGTQILEMPERVINSDGIEVYILTGCLVLSAFALIIMIDFVKDYVKTYFLKRFK